MIGSNPTEPANYRGSYTTVSKEIAEIEIATCRNSGIIIITTSISLVTSWEYC